MQDALELLKNPHFTPAVEALKIFLIVFSAFMFGFIVWALHHTTWLKRFLLEDMAEITTYRPYGTQKSNKEWEKILARLDSEMESEYKLAIIEADGILDNVLKRMGYSGETLGDKLNSLSVATLPNLDQVLSGHKIRNNIVHDPDYRLSLDQTRQIISYYERAFRDLQIID